MQYPRLANRYFIFATLIVICFGRQTLGAPPPSVQELVAQFSATNYLNIVSNKLYTRQGMNRAPGGAQHDLCRDAIFTEFQRVGLNPYKDIFTYIETNSLIVRTACNVIAVKPGVRNPSNEIYVVGSHYDSKNNPGVDDNATGVACQLEMARIFAQYEFDKTLVFCAFDAEEIYDINNTHRLGSVRYVNQHKTDNIKAMVSVDMIGWQTTGSLSNYVNIEGRPETSSVQTALASAIQIYSGGLRANYRSPGNYSDHVAFADAGFQACLLIEANWSSNPNYHKSTDYVEKANYINWTYVGKVCKGVIGFYATQLQSTAPDPVPIYLSVGWGLGGSVQIRFAGTPGNKYALEVNTNMNSPVWTVLGTNTAPFPDGDLQIVDGTWSGRSNGFYRVRSVPSN